MFITETQIRVHYALTDQMGFAYYGHYAQFYEIGRVEAFRQIGIKYKDIEAMGIIMPVVEMHCRFLRPAKYDDLITVKTTMRELPDNHKVIFQQEIYNEEDQLLNSGIITLYFMKADGMKKSEMPAKMKEKLAGYFAK
jgi:acyl-CoA thioester hydrolase